MLGARTTDCARRYVNNLPWNIVWQSWYLRPLGFTIDFTSWCLPELQLRLTWFVRPLFGLNCGEKCASPRTSPGRLQTPMRPAHRPRHASRLIIQVLLLTLLSGNTGWCELFTFQKMGPLRYQSVIIPNPGFTLKARYQALANALAYCDVKSTGVYHRC